MAVEPRQVDDESVRHLIKLGYVDPEVVAAQRAVRQQQLECELRAAMALIGEDRRSEAVAVLDRLVSEAPDWTMPRQLLADAHFCAGDEAAARRHLDWLASHGVVTPRLALIEGTLALARRELNTALEELKYAAHVEPGLSAVHALLGTVLTRLHRWDAAEEAFQKALQQNPADARAMDGLVAVELERGNYEAAAEWALDALAHDMSQYQAHYRLGVALVHLERHDAAIEAFTAAARIDLTRAAPYYWLSRIAGQKLGDSARAAVYREHGREIVRRRHLRPRGADSADC